jgi:hypothetical protein
MLKADKQTLLPTAISVTLAPAAVREIPSIMCGFALIFALILAGGIIPKAGKVRQ